MTTFMTKGMGLVSTMIAFLVMGLTRYSMFISGADQVIAPWILMTITGVLFISFFSFQLSRELEEPKNDHKRTFLYMQLIGMTAVATLVYMAIEYGPTKF